MKQHQKEYRKDNRGIPKVIKILTSSTLCMKTRRRKKIPAQITGSDQIGFILCFPTVASYITESGIISFMDVGMSDHQGLLGYKPS